MSLLELLDEVPHSLVTVTAGKYDEPGRMGSMTAVWFSRVAYDPPLFTVAMVPTHHTYALIKEFKAFVINVVSESLADIAKGVFGSISGWQVDKFSECKITLISARSVDASVIPYAALVIECKYVTEFPVGETIEAYRGISELSFVRFRGNSAELVGG